MDLKVFSGGQTGADEGGVEAARSVSFATGGTMPKGFRTRTGNRPDFAALYGMVEHHSMEYAPRTVANVENTDATLWIGSNPDSRGKACTFKAVKKFKRPSLQIDDTNPPHPSVIAQWIIDGKMKVLNVAGEAEEHCPGIYAFTVSYLTLVFKIVKDHNDH